VFDFAPGEDKIGLDDAIFTALTPGALPDTAFRAGKKALTPDQHVLYNNGKLSYDADGSGDAKAVVFAKLVGKPEIGAADILVV
jgi:hypothetical protein